MKIIYLHQYFNLPKSAGGSRSYEMARRLAARGHDVHIVTSEREGAVEGGGWRMESVDGINIHWSPVPYSNAMSYRERIAAFFSFAFKAATYSRSLRGDVVFATSTPLTIALPAVFASIFRRSPMVFEVRDLWPEVPIAMGALANPITRFLARSLEKFAYRHSAHVVALSPGMKEGIVRAGYPASKITVIPNASDLELFEGNDGAASQWRNKYEWLGERSMVLYCGTIGKVNDIRFLVDVAAATYSIDPEVRFVVVGNGAEESLVKEHATELGILGKNFFMLPPVPKSDVPVIFAAANICTNLVLPLKEMESNSANKFYDALASGKPVAINYGGWHKTILEECQAGIYLDPHDHRLASQTLLELIRDDAKIELVGRAARKLAESEFSRDRLASSLAEVLESSANPGLV